MLQKLVEQYRFAEQRREAQLVAQYIQTGFELAQRYYYVSKHIRYGKDIELENLFFRAEKLEQKYCFLPKNQDEYFIPVNFINLILLHQDNFSTVHIHQELYKKLPEEIRNANPKQNIFIISDMKNTLFYKHSSDEPVSQLRIAV